MTDRQEDKELRRRKWQMKRLNEMGGERRFRTKEQVPKPIKEKKRKVSKRELINYAYDPDRDIDIDSW